MLQSCSSVTRLSPRRKAVPPGQRIGRADFQLLIDVRRFQIETDSHPTAHISLSARILDKNGKVIASRLFEQSEKFDRLEPQAAVLAFNGAFDRLAACPSALPSHPATGSEPNVYGHRRLRAGQGLQVRGLPEHVKMHRQGKASTSFA